MRVTGFKKFFKLQNYFFLLIFIFLILVYFTGLKNHQFHLDEYLFVKRSYFFDLFFIKRDLKNPNWHLEAEDQPKIGPYLYGLTLHLSGVDKIAEIQRETNFNEFKIENEFWPYHFWLKELKEIPQGLEPAMNLIYQGRKTAVLFSLAALLILFFLLKKTSFVGFALMAAFLLGVNNLLLTYGKRAMTDSIQLFFLFANLYLIFLYLQEFYQKRNHLVILVSLAIGVNAALSTGSKLSGLFALVFFFEIGTILFFLQLLRAEKSTMKLIILTSLLAGFTFFILFVFFHPYLYQDTLAHFLTMFLNRLGSVEKYKMVYPGSAIYDKNQAIFLILQRTLLPENDWGNFGFLRVIPLDLGLFLWGGFLLLRKAKEAIIKKKRLCFEGVLLLWVLTTMVGLTFYLGNDWPRYYLPTVAGVTIVQAYALAFFTNYVLKNWLKVILN